MAILEKSEAVRELAVVLNHSQYRPQEIREAQFKSTCHLRHARQRFLEAANRYDQAIARVRKAMEETHTWEKRHQAFIQEFKDLCEQLKAKEFRRRETIVRRIRAKLGEKFQEQVKREPVLRRLMSKSRSRPPTPISISAAASVTHPKL